MSSAPRRDRARRRRERSQTGELSCDNFQQLPKSIERQGALWEGCDAWNPPPPGAGPSVDQGEVKGQRKGRAGGPPP